jgi:hypothetical protein
MPIPDDYEDEDHCADQSIRLNQRKSNASPSTHNIGGDESLSYARRRVPPSRFNDGGEEDQIGDHSRMPPSLNTNGGDDEEYRVIRLNRLKDDNRLDDVRSSDSAFN